MDDLFHDRRPSPSVDAETGVDRNSLKMVNKQLRDAAPDYARGEVNKRIRQTAVRRTRTKARGGEDFSSAAEYAEFIWGQSAS